MRQIKCDRCKRIIVHRRGGVTVLDDKIGRISISSETEVGLAGEENIGQLEDWDICPACIEKIVKFIRNEEIEEPPEALPDDKKAPEEPEAYEPQITEEAFEALELAIRALGTDTNVGTTDVISRRAAIEH